MVANPKFLAATAHVDEAAVQPLPNSRKVYIQGSRPDLRVPMREITQADTPASFGAETQSADLCLRHLRSLHRPAACGSTSATACRRCARAWIAERADTEELPGPTSRYGARAAARSEARGDALQPQAQAAARHVRRQRHPDALRAPRHRHAGDGVRRAARELPQRGAGRGLGEGRRAGSRSAARGPASRPVVRRQRCRSRSRPSSCATRWRAGAPSSRPTSTIRKASR